MQIGVNTQGVGGWWDGQKVWRVGGPAKSAGPFGARWAPRWGPWAGFGLLIYIIPLIGPIIRRFYCRFHGPTHPYGSVWSRPTAVDSGPTVGPTGDMGRRCHSRQPYKTNHSTNGY